MNRPQMLRPSQTSQEEDDIDLMRVLATFWRGKWIILFLMVVGAAVGGYYTLRVAAPLYPSVVTVALNPQQQQVLGDIESIFSGGGTDSATINTEIEVFRSRRLIGALVDELDLVSDPEFNWALRDPTPVQQIRRAVLGGGGAMPPIEVQRRSTIDAVIGRLQVNNIRLSLAFNLRIETGDPQKSALIVNTLADLYLRGQIEQKLEGAAQAIRFLSVRTAELEANLRDLEQQLAQMNEETSVLTAEVLQARNLQLGDLRDRISELEERIAEETAALAPLRSAAAFDALLPLLEASEDARLRAIFQRFRTNRLTEGEAMAAVQDTVAELEQEGERSAAQLDALRRSEAQLAEVIRDEADQLIVVQQLEREVDAARLLYESFFTRLQEASVQQGLETADARILSEAVPRRASSPSLNRNVGIMAAIGMLLGAGVVLLRELRFSGFRTPDGLSDTTGRSVLGSIPRLPVQDRGQVLHHLRENQNSIFAEAVRNLRTSIMMASLDKEPQVILLTSSVPSEGKTTLSVALARHFASLEGRKTLLLEADLRRQTLRAYTRKDLGNGLIDMLLGKTRLGEVDLFNEEFGLDVLAGSNDSSNAADLFASRRFTDLLQSLRADYDYIVIDSPPVLAVPDARVLAGMADAVVFVVRWSSTTRAQVGQGLQMIRSVGADVTGTVLTQIDQKQMKRYGYAGQYGYDTKSSAYYE